MNATMQACPQTPADLDSSSSSGFTPLLLPCSSEGAVIAGVKPGAFSSGFATPRAIEKRRTDFAAPHLVHVRIHGFFAAVEQALRPRLRGKAVFVGRNTVISTSYEATRVGVVTGMVMKRALALCPAAVVVPARPDRYAECSGRLRVVLETFTPAVDPDSHHGFYLNFFGSPHLQDDSLGTLRRLQLEILKLTGLSVSIGAAKSKVAAAVASRLERPGGVRIIASGAEAAFLASLSVEALDGLHSIDAKNLRSRGISTVAELRRVPLPALEIAFGQSVGRQIWHHARGLDVRPAAAWPTGPLLSSWPALAWLPSPFRKFASSFLGAKALPTCFSFAVGMRHLKSSRRFMFASHSG